jgi:hypothetical protein
LKSNTTFELHQLAVVVRGALTSTLIGIVRVEVRVRLRRADIVHRVDRIMTRRHCLGHTNIIRVQRGSRDRRRRHRITARDLCNRSRGRRGLHVGVQFSTFDEVVNGFLDLYNINDV